MLFSRLAQVSQEVAATRARSRKIALLAELFRAAEPDDVPIVIPYLAGRLPQGRLGVGWRVLRDPVEPATQPRLTVQDVDAALTALGDVAGAGSQAERSRLVGELMGAATEDEQRFLFGLLTGELRQGALDAVALEGLAQATGAPPEEVRRAVMLTGSLQVVAQSVLAEGPDALSRFRLTVGRPVFPMLAHSASSVGEAVDKLGACAVEEKLDGIRVQVHRDGDVVRVYTRTLDDITDRLPEVTAAAAGLDGDRFILDGEVIALDGDRRPRPSRRSRAAWVHEWTWRRPRGPFPWCRCSSTPCPRAGTSCSICRSPSATHASPGWCRRRCGCATPSYRTERTRRPARPPTRSSPTPCGAAMKASS